MKTGTRMLVAVGVLLLLGGLAGLGWWYQMKQRSADQGSGVLAVNVTSAADRGPGTLREAFFIAATAKGRADVFIKVKSIAIESLLPPLVNPHGVRIVAQQGGTQLDGRGLSGGPLLDIAGDNTSVEGLELRNCAATAILLRATQFHLRSSTIESCDVGVDVAENATGILIERNHFTNDRIGVRFAATPREAVVVGNEFANARDAGLWAVRAQPDARGNAITIRENHFNNDRSGLVAANVAVLIERNDFATDTEAAIHLIGAGAVVRGNSIRGGPGMGIIAENAREAIIDGNELDHLSAYGIMVRNSANVLVRANRIHNCGYGLAFVLGEQRHPSTAVENTIIEPQFNGIDVIGDSPILQRNQVVQPHAFALHVTDFQPPGGVKVLAHPFLEGNSFRAADTTSMAAAPVPATGTRQ
jgi:parallel beta-helix repeat protein